MLAGQHLGGATSANPNSEKDHEQSGGKHHLTGICGSIPDGEGEGHRTSQAWGKKHQQTTLYTNEVISVSKHVLFIFKSVYSELQYTQGQHPHTNLQTSSYVGSWI